MLNLTKLLTLDKIQNRIPRQQLSPNRVKERDLDHYKILGKNKAEVLQEKKQKKTFPDNGQSKKEENLH